MGNGNIDNRQLSADIKMKNNKIKTSFVSPEKPMSGACAKKLMFISTIF